MVCALAAGKPGGGLNQTPMRYYPVLLTLLIPTTLFASDAAEIRTEEAPKNVRTVRQQVTQQGSGKVVPVKQEEQPKLPPLPEGVEELKFSEFFKTPVGPKGLEITEQLKSMDGKRVRIVGYMVKEDPTACNSCVNTADAKKKRLPAWMEAIVPGRMMLTPYPAAVSHSHYALADDLPPQTVFIEVPELIGEMVPYTPGVLALTGTISVGNKNEMDNRISIVRLKLDPRPKLAAEEPQVSATVSNP